MGGQPGNKRENEDFAKWAGEIKVEATNCRGQTEKGMGLYAVGNDGIVRQQHHCKKLIKNCVNEEMFEGNGSRTAPRNSPFVLSVRNLQFEVIPVHHIYFIVILPCHFAIFCLVIT